MLRIFKENFVGYLMLSENCPHENEVRFKKMNNLVGKCKFIIGECKIINKGKQGASICLRKKHVDKF